MESVWLAHHSDPGRRRLGRGPDGTILRPRRQTQSDRSHRRIPKRTADAAFVGVADWADRDEILRRSSTFAAGGKLLRLEFPETQMQVYGNVAILYTSFVFETQQDGQRNVTTGRGTEVFVNRDGKWVNTGWHLERQEAGATP